MPKKPNKYKRVRAFLERGRLFDAIDLFEELSIKTGFKTGAGKIKEEYDSIMKEEISGSKSVPQLKKLRNLLTGKFISILELAEKQQ